MFITHVLRTVSDTFLPKWCQEGKPHPIGWAHRDIYGKKCLKDILWTNMTINMPVGLSAYQNSLWMEEA